MTDRERIEQLAAALELLLKLVAELDTRTGTPDGFRRLLHIQRLIEEARRNDPAAGA